MNNKALRLVFPFFIIAFTLVLYISTLLPGVSTDGDSSKFQFIGKVLGVPHTTGFPTYVLLNRTFVNIIPLKSIAWRANLMSAVFASAACLILYFLLLRLTGYRLLAFAAAMLFSVTYTFWTYAVMARHYTLNLFFFCAVLLLLVKWRDEKKDYLLYSALILYSISLGNHPTIIFLLPAVFYIILITDKKMLFSRKTITVYLAMAAIGVILYSYLFIRTYQKAAYVEVPIHTLKDFLWYITGAQFRENIYFFSPQKAAARIADYLLPLFKKEFFFPGFFALGIFGILISLLKKPAQSVFLIIPPASGSLWFLFLSRTDCFEHSRYFIFTYLVFVLFIALGAYHILRSIGSQKIRKAAYAAITLFLLAGTAALTDKNYGLIVRNNDAAGELQEVVEKTLGFVKKDAVILEGRFEYSEAFWYYILADERWKDKNIYLVHHVDPGRIRQYLEGKTALSLPEENYRSVPLNLPVYTLRDFPDLKSRKIADITGQAGLYQIL